MRYNDLMEMKNDTTRMNTIRERVSRKIAELLKEEFGEDYILYIEKEIGITPNASKVAKNTVVADVGDVKDSEGFEVGACVEITVKVKKWNTVENKSGNVIYGVTLDDYTDKLTGEKSD